MSVLASEKQTISTEKTYSIFFLSDGTGITVETLGNTLLTQFDHANFNTTRHPYLDTADKVSQVVKEINRTCEKNATPAIIFSTLVASESRKIIQQCNGLLFDLFDIFIAPIENHLGLSATKHVGLSHGMGKLDNYQDRIDTVHFSMANDDGITTRNYAEADVILIGVSRTGKTPTCLYLALNYGIRAANYPLNTDDLNSENLPEALKKFKNKLFGLTINANRLQQIRRERRPNSDYAKRSQCQYEVRSVEALYQTENIPYVDTSTMSIEEISTFILQDIPKN